MAIENGCAVLMARIVDRDGRAIRPTDVAAIEYWIYELERRLPLDGHDGVELDVGDVMLDALQTDRWTVDVVGYNFRHEIDVLRIGKLAAADRHFELCYLFTSEFGERMIIRFQLGRLSR